MLIAAIALIAPFVLLLCIQTPDHDVAASPPVVVPVGVVGAPALIVVRGAEERSQSWIELSEEDEIVGPFMEMRFDDFLFEVIAGGFGGEPETTGHLGAQESCWVVVELVGFVSVDGLLGGVHVDWWLTG